jgi:cyanate lyase
LAGPTVLILLSLPFVTAALLGQHPLPANAAKVVADKLDLGEDAVRLLQTIPARGHPGRRADRSDDLPVL